LARKTGRSTDANFKIAASTGIAGLLIMHMAKQPHHLRVLSYAPKPDL
jgi:hypothetical protein